MQVAASLGLDTLVEAHDARGARPRDRARRDRARCQRPRSRDVRDRPPAQLELVARIPEDRIVIAESGIETRAQGAAAELAGADAVLVGSTLMRAGDPAAKLAELLSRPLVKVCGLTREEDVAAAAEAGADLAGFILVPESPRAARPCSPVPDGMLSVAVWVGEAGAAGADLDQVHTVEEGKVRGREAALAPRRASRSPGCSTSPGRARTRTTGRRAAAAEGRVVLAGRLGPGQRAGGDRGGSAVGGRRGLVARVAPGNQGSRQGEAIRGGSPLMTTTETYGPYGGRYVPETLIPALDELTAAWAEALADPAYLAEVEHLGRTYTGRPSPITLAPRFAPDKRLYLKREDLNHTGAHKINNALGQVVLARRLGKTRIIAETGAGPARRRHRDRLRAVRARMRRLHGLRGHAPPGAERRAHAPDGRDGRPGRVRHEDAEGGDERGDPRLDHERRDDALRDRLVRRPGAVPGDRARAAGGDRPRGARAAARGGGRPAGGGRGLRRRRLERDRDVRRVHRRPRRAARSASRRRAQRRSAAGGRACSTARARRSSPTTTARSPTPTRSRPGSTTRASAPSTPTSATRAAPSTCPARTRRRSTRSSGSRAPRGSSPRSSRRTRSRSSTRIDAEYIAVCLSGRGDKDLAEALAALWEHGTVRQGARHLPHGRRRDAGARRGRRRRRRRHRRDRLPVLRPARRRAGDPRRGREGARRRDAHGRLPRVPRRDARARRRRRR